MIGMRAALPRNERRHPVSRVGGWEEQAPTRVTSGDRHSSSQTGWLGRLGRETAGAKINPQVFSVPEGSTS